MKKGKGIGFGGERGEGKMGRTDFSSEENTS